MRVRVCSFTYPARNVYTNSRFSQFANGPKNIERKVCVLIFSTTFVRNNSHFNNNSASCSSLVVFVACCESFGLCDGLTGLSEESYRVCVCVCVCEIKKPQQWCGLGPSWTVVRQKKILFYFWQLHMIATALLMKMGSIKTLNDLTHFKNKWMYYIVLIWNSSLVYTCLFSVCAQIYWPLPLCGNPLQLINITSLTAS